MSSWQQTRKQDASPGSGGYGCNPERPGWGAEGLVTGCGPESLVNETSLMEEIVKRENLIAAWKKVKENGGAAGIDGMTVKELTPYLNEHWPQIKEELISGNYKPSPVRRVEIPKASGGTRNLGIPTVVDRFIQQAILQVLQSRWDRTFSESSYGFRPGRSAHQAVAKAHIKKEALEQLKEDDSGIITDWEKYRIRFKKFIKQLNDVAKSELADYVIHRKTVLSFLLDIGEFGYDSLVYF